MSIRLKLNILVLSVASAFVLSISIFLILNSSVERILEEQRSLESLSATLMAVTLEASKTASAVSLEAQSTAVDTAIGNMKREFERIGTLRILPKSAMKIQVALGRIENQQTLIILQVNDFKTKLDALLDDGKKLFGESGKPGMLDFYDFFQRKGGAELKRESVHYDVTLLYSQISTMMRYVDVSTVTIQQELQIIGEETARIRGRITWISLALFFLVSAAGVFFSLLVSAGVSRSIRRIESSIGRLKEGDLTARAGLRTGDDLERLSTNLDTFLGVLSSAVTRIKDISKDTILIKDNLMNAAGESSVSLAQMETGIRSMKSQIDALDEKIMTSTDSSGMIFQNIALLNTQLLEQSGMVEETSSSITEMIHSIENVTRIIEDRRKAITHLIETARKGGTKLASTTEIVNEVYRSLDNIAGVAMIIRKIASRTNLLAMNAAIEAAHAGDSGRGFSVVAQEIRQLAEATNKQSGQISADLKSIMQKITGATASSGETLDAFREIDAEIGSMSLSLSEIFDNTGELLSGGKQVLDAVVSLRDSSLQVKEASAEIAEHCTATAESMGTVKNISRVVRAEITEISSGIAEISKATAGTVSLTGAMAEVNEDLNQQVTRFKTEAVVSAEPDPVLQTVPD